MDYRTITTQAELDALPIETIIRDAEGLALEKDGTKDDNNDPGPRWCYGDNAVEVELPAIVLWEPPLDH